MNGVPGQPEQIVKTVIGPGPKQSQANVGQGECVNFFTLPFKALSTNQVASGFFIFILTFRALGGNQFYDEVYGSTTVYSQ